MERPSVTSTEPELKRLYGPNGEVLRTFSDRPPIGFHTARTSNEKTCNTPTQG